MDSKHLFFIKDKRLFQFLLATIALLLSGSIAIEKFDPLYIGLLILAGFCGVVLIYDLPLINHQLPIKERFQDFLKHKRKVFYTVLLLIISPLALTVFSTFTFILLAITAILGVLYSFPFKINGEIIRLKNFLFLKNFLIGIAWGALILIGGGNWENPLLIALFIFASLQVFIGSMIRDVPDVEQDKRIGIRSFPVAFGVGNTISFMQVLNLLSFGLGYIIYPEIELIILISIITAWRFVNIYMLKKDRTSILWGQTLNLMTCCLFFGVILIQHLYELYA
ncbi:MAG: UbiA family prenyltransferase [Bacteroidota bacterium]